MNYIFRGGFDIVMRMKGFVIWAILWYLIEILKMFVIHIFLVLLIELRIKLNCLKLLTCYSQKFIIIKRVFLAFSNLIFRIFELW